ncbi:MAG: hypothetical protein PWR10_1550 [Halanaerobiales bacterium]|nr:hypothetical protein [Halanaerobiales bacterium]
MILDQYGRELKSTKKPDTREIATVTVRDRYSTYPSSGLTPEKLARIFKEADSGDVSRQSELFEEMEEKDPHLFNCLQIRRNSVLGANADYEIIAASEEQRDIKIAKFVEEQIKSIPDFEDFLKGLLEAIGHGFKIGEILWDVSEGQAAIKNLKILPNKKFTFYNSTLPRLITDKNPSEGEELPPFKFVYHRHRAKSGSPTRAGVLRVTSWMYLFKNYSIKDWVSFAEVYGMPLRLGKYDPNATKNDKNALIAAIRSLGTDAAGIISKNTEIEFVEAMKQSGQNNVYETLSNFCNREISKAILGQTLTTDTTGSTGTYAAAKVHEMVRQDLKESDAKSLADTVNSQIIRPLVGFNFGWDAPLPEFQINVYKPEDLKSIAEIYKTLVEMGFQEITEEHIHEKFGIPKPKKDEKVVRSPELQITNTNPQPRAFKFNQGFTPEQENIEGLIDNTVASSKEIYKRYIRDIKKVIINSNSYEEIQEKLYTMYDQLNSSELEELTARALFVADLYGRVSANEN